MIGAIGVDLIEIDRVVRLVEEYGERFLHRVFTETELSWADGQGERIAGRFAAKEAVLKVIGTGLAEGISWKEVEIIAGSKGAPIVTLSGVAAERAAEAGIGKIHISISHDKERVVAFAVGEAAGDGASPAAGARAGS